MDKAYIFTDIEITDEDLIEKILKTFIDNWHPVRECPDRVEKAHEDIESIVNSEFSEYKEVMLWEGMMACPCSACPVDSTFDTWWLQRICCDDVHGSAEYYYKYILTKG